MEQWQEFMVTAFIAMEALLLGVFGNLLGVYARYQTSDGDNLEEAEITKIIKRMCYFMSGLLILVGILALVLVYQILMSAEAARTFWFLALAALIILIPVPALYLTHKMH